MDTKNLPKWKELFQKPSSNEQIPKSSIITISESRSTHSISNSQKPTMLENKHVLAFAPLNFSMNSEMIELEDKLSEEAHLHGIHHPVIHENQYHESEDEFNQESVIMPKDVLNKLLNKATPESVKKNSFGSGPSNRLTAVYDWLPRPFTKHLVDIEKRRARKVIDIMNSTKEQFTFSEKDQRVKFAPSGVLIFHVLELYNLSVNATTFIKSLPVSFYCVLNIGSIRRCSKIVHSRTAIRIRMDFASHFSLDLSEWRESATNRFYVELWSFQDPETHYIVGTMEFHVYEFIRKQHGIEIHQLWSDGVKMGKCSIEYSFTYGYFGYGHSNQFRNPLNPIMETVSHSTFPRIRMDGNEEMDKIFKVKLPDKLKCFTFSSLILEMDQSLLHSTSQIKEQKRGVKVEDLEPRPMIVQQVKFENGKPVHCKLHMNIYQRILQADFNDAYGEFICIGNRKSRLDYLNNLSIGRMRDIRETEAGWLFHGFKEREAEKILQTEPNHPGYIIFPNKIPCPLDWGVNKLNNEEEKLLDEFPSVRRESGYLNTIFGYEKKPEPQTYINDMDYPLYKEAGTIKKSPFSFSCQSFRGCFLRIGAILNWLYNFILPEVRKRPMIPEISVTIPTPEGSTTDIFTYFVRDQKDFLGLNKVEKLQSQVTAFMESIENPAEDDSTDSITESSSEDEELKLKAPTPSILF